MLLTRASGPPFVDHSTIPRVDITEMNTRARFSKSICTKHSPQQHFPIGYLRCHNFFVVTKLSPCSFKVTLFAFCLLHSCNLHSCNLHNCSLHNCCSRESEVFMLMPDLDQRIFVLQMSILMFIDFECPISVLGIWETHVCPKSFVFNVLLNLSFSCYIWISPFSHLRELLFCLMILYSICYKTHHFLPRSGPAHLQASKQAYAM